jgi:hypothetical protein
MAGLVQPGTSGYGYADLEQAKFIESGGTVSVRVSSTSSGGTFNAGTINSGTINSGTINAGTINAGTVRDDGRSARNILTFGTQVITSGTAYATIVGSASVGAGTSLWVQDLSIVNPNGTVAVAVGFNAATAGTSVLVKGVFGTQGAPGIEKSYAKAVNAGMTNSDLVVYHSAAATVDYSFSYFIST